MATVEEEVEQAVSPLELFFDLVFVFAITQVSAFVSHDAGWTRLFEGIAILAALWFAWESYVWLANTAASDEGAVRVVLLSTMGALLIASLAVPHAFGEDALVFGVAYFDVRAAHIAGASDPHRAVVGVGVLRVAGQHRGLRRGDRARRAAVGHGRDAHRVAGRPARVRRRRGDLRRRLPGGARAASRGLRVVSRDDPQLRHVVVRMATTMLPASMLHRRGRRSGRHRAGAHVGGGAGGRLRRPGRARHRGLARGGRPLLRAPRPGHHHRPGRVDRRVGVGAEGLGLDAGIIVGALLGVAVAAALWWAYFDFVALVAARVLREARPTSRCGSRATPTPTCTCRWWPGSSLFALGVKKTLAHVGDDLEAVPAVALCGGVALYLVALSAFKRRNIGSFNCPRLVAAAAAGRAGAGGDGDAGAAGAGASWP